MIYQDLKRSNEAPESGQLLAYTRKKVYFQPYGSLSEVELLLQNEMLLELHLFDQDKEYRAIVTRSRRFKDSNTEASTKDGHRTHGIIETIADFSEEDTASIYKERARLFQKNFLEEQASDNTNSKVITVLNHISYGENGMAYVDNYRLQMGGK